MKRSEDKKQTHLEYSSSKETENKVPAESETEVNGQVSVALRCKNGSNSDSNRNKTSIFQRSLSPNTRRCASTEPSTPERGGQRWKRNKHISATSKAISFKLEKLDNYLN